MKRRLLMLFEVNAAVLTAGTLGLAWLLAWWGGLLGWLLAITVLLVCGSASLLFLSMVRTLREEVRADREARRVS